MSESVDQLGNIIKEYAKKQQKINDRVSELEQKASTKPVLSTRRSVGSAHSKSRKESGERRVSAKMSPPVKE